MDTFGILFTVTTIGYIIYYAVVIFMDLNKKEEKKTGVTETIDTSDFQIEASKVSVDPNGNVVVGTGDNQPEGNKGEETPKQEGDQQAEKNKNAPSAPEDPKNETSIPTPQDDEESGKGGVDNPLSIDKAQNAVKELEPIIPDFQGGMIDDTMFMAQMININHNKRIKMRNVSH